MLRITVVGDDASPKEKMRAAFDMVDVDKSGCLDAKEVSEALKRLDSDLDEASTIELLHRRVAATAVREQCKYVRELTKHGLTSCQHELSHRFVVSVKGGAFSVSSAYFVVRTSGNEPLSFCLWSQEDVAALLALADLDQDGSVCFEEFCRILQWEDGGPGSDGASDVTSRSKPE